MYAQFKITIIKETKKKWIISQPLLCVIRPRDEQNKRQIYSRRLN